MSAATFENDAEKQNILGLASDQVTGSLFNLLHGFDDDGITDSSKNLRVLWARAALHRTGEIHDPIAETMLPPTTRDHIVAHARWRA